MDRKSRLPEPLQDMKDQRFFLYKTADQITGLFFKIGLHMLEHPELCPGLFQPVQLSKHSGP